MKRFVLSDPPSPEGMIRLYDKDYHYLVRVRRLKCGSFFNAVLPGGAETRIRVLSTVDNILIGECLGCEKRPSLITPIALFQGLPKGYKMDLVVRQAAETGVSVVAPFESEYSSARLNCEKLKRWERIVREARQQSGSATETVVRPPCGFDALLAYWESLKKEYERPLGILFHQEALEDGPLGTPTDCNEVKGGSPLAKRTFHGYLCDNPDFVALAVGPEGGFSPGEVSLFLEAGFRPLLMGSTILRTETAALYASAVTRIILMESNTWTPRG